MKHFALILPLLLLIACDFSEESYTTEPPVPVLCGDGVCGDGESNASCPADCPVTLTCAAPSTVSATVTAAPCGVTDCTVSFSSADPSYRRWSWSFVTCNPNSANTSTGSVACPRPVFFPSSVDWSVSVCTSTAAEDPSGICCNGTSDRVVLVEPGPQLGPG